jgi:hypothetical protein
MQNDTPNYPNWFVGQQYNFENHLTPLAGKANIHFLQIGVYTGEASVWLLENILTAPTSLLLDVDTWEGSGESEHTQIDFDKVVAKMVVVETKFLSSDEYMRKFGFSINFDGPDTFYIR